MEIKTLKKKIQVVTIAENQLLLLQFSKTSLYHKGFQNITGSVEADETYREAAQRELQEELGIPAIINFKIYDLSSEFIFFDRWGFNVCEKVFLCLFQSRPNIILSDEHEAYKWVPVEEVTLADFLFQTNFEAFQIAKRFIQNEIY